MNTKSTIVLFLLLATTSTLLHAQSSDTILPNPNAVLLRKIWMIRGETTGPNAGGMVGDGAGTLGDLNGDSLTDFAVRSAKNGQWRFFSGKAPAPDTLPFWVFDHTSAELGRPIIGDFFGNGHPLVGISQDSCRFTTSTICYYRLRLFQPQPNGTIPDTALLNLLTNVQPCVDVQVGNLDSVPGDELVLAYYCYTPELWIYKGGPDFQVRTPTYRFKEEEELRVGTRYSVQLADLDGDRRMDMVIGGHYSSGTKLKIWYGRDGSPWNWNSTPDRVIHLANNIGLNTPLTFADYDGDSLLDFAGRVFEIQNPGTYIFLSSSGKSFRNRSFALDDADIYFRTSLYGPLGSVGYLNDLRHEMLALYGPKPRPLFFSATDNGIDPFFDAYFAGGLEEEMAYKIRVPLRDCNGDGWGDLLVTDWKWWGFDQGIAMILAGGPYIPNDDPSVDVEQLPVEGKSNAISLWPNPVRDQLNIAWHGGLSLPPARIAIHDLTGRLVASGTTDPSVGAAVWHADAVADGTYFLTLYDRNGVVVATKLFNKQR
ncbi:MAG: T9SS type A sorting domain-containing protein [Chlorobi bacterium]|nr:MAG: FG-GAP repeat protein [Chlorobi bacterium OLB7]MBK8911594.1 T9SS type A sorting domain-containing protein [Chlorobiota bacterium]MBX7215712.1 T9SS type A sorting domain-containing protein [Candidatus Kapabacteria bacterium]